MLASKLILLFFAIPVAIIVGFMVYALIRQKTNGQTTSHVFNLLFNKDRAVADNAAASAKDLTIPSFDGTDTLSSDPVQGQLDSDAAASAMITWCRQQGPYNGSFRYDSVTSKCTPATEEVCNQFRVDTYDLNTIFTPEESPFLVWQEDRCLLSRSGGNSCFNMCEYREAACNENVLPSDPTYLAPQKSGSFKGKCVRKTDKDCTNFNFLDVDLTCDDQSFCQPKITQQFPRCIIAKSYCQRKGVSYTHDPISEDTFHYLGDCFETDSQSIAETVFGKTLVRSIKGSLNQNSQWCKDQGPSSQSCATAISGLGLESVIIGVIIDAVKAEYVKDFNKFKRECGITPDPGQSTTFGTPAQLYACVDSTLTLFGGMWVLKDANKLINGLIDGLFGLVPGMPKLQNVDFFALNSIIVLASEGLMAIYKFGTGIMKPFRIAGKDAATAYNVILKKYNSKLLAVGAEGCIWIKDVVGGELLNVFKFTGAVLIAGLDCVGAQIKDVADFALMCGEALTHLVGAGLKWICQKLNLCSSNVPESCGLQIMSKIFGPGVKFFFESLAQISKVWAKTWDTIKDDIEKAVKDFECFFITC